MSIGLYFGSFNPIHNGHLIIAEQVINSQLVKEVWFVVSPQNPFKQEKNLLNANHRFHLVQLAIEGENKLKASRVEFGLPIPSYTVNTLTYLNEKYPKEEFKIILGSDGFENISNWKNAEYILKNYSFLIYKRNGHEKIENNTAKFEIIDGPMLMISSTEIRKLIKNKKSIRYLVPDSVMEEIKNNNYYSI